LGTEELLAVRAKLVDEKAYYVVLGKVANVSPEKGDEINS